jgi:hypothetical protein
LNHAWKSYSDTIDADPRRDIMAEHINGSDQTVSEAARRLAQAHYQVEPGISAIYPIVSDDPADRTIRLLEVNPSTFPSGIMPVSFAPHPPSGIPFPSVIVEVTPSEFGDIQEGRLPLPRGWSYESQPIARPPANTKE